MNIKVILSKCYTLIYREHQLSQDNGNSNKDFILDILRKIDIGDSGPSLNQEGKKLFELKNLIVDMCRLPHGQIDLSGKNRDLQVICEEDESLYNAIRESVKEPLDDKAINEQVKSIRQDIHTYVKEDEIRKKLQQATSKAIYRSHEIKDMRKFISEVISDLDSFVQDTEKNKKDPAITAEMGISKDSSTGVLDVFKDIIRDAKGESILKFPWQCMNRMTRGGLRLGQVTTIAALQHHNKSGFSLSSILGFCYFNKAKDILKDKNKIPSIVLISFENEPDKIVGDVYMTLKENIDGEKVDTEALSKIQIGKAQECVTYIQEKTTVNGYNLHIMRVNPSEWTYVDIFNKIIELETEKNYEIHCCLIDYLNQIPKTGCNGNNDSDKIQDLFNRVRNFFSKKRIALITPHQLSSEALELHRQGKTDLALIVSDGNYYAGSKGIGREVDLELFLYLAKDSGKSYQCIARGKHRLPGITNPDYLYYIIPFEEVGALRWDMYTNDKGEYTHQDVSVKHIGSRRTDTGEEEMPFWL